MQHPPEIGEPGSTHNLYPAFGSLPIRCWLEAWGELPKPNMSRDGSWPGASVRVVVLSPPVEGVGDPDPRAKGPAGQHLAGGQVARGPSAAPGE